MQIILSYNGRIMKSREELLNTLSDDSIAKATRSTVPLMRFWRQPEKQLPLLWQALGLPEAKSVELAFEYPTAVRAGRGKASFTDLMLIADSSVVAVEAKYTEPRYKSVNDWLGGSPTVNQQAVLGGWLDAIALVGGRQLSAQDVKDLPYQLVHRTASACCIDRSVRAVIYQVFGDAPQHIYASDLGRLARLLGSSPGVCFWVQSCTYTPAGEFAIRDKSARHSAVEQIRAALLADTGADTSLVTFSGVAA